ncbi:MAG: hypothetical protein ACR2O3_06260, partial [Rhizobiaceae bacterium]
TAVHDSIAPEVNGAGVVTDTGGWAYKVSANLDLSEWVPGGSIWGVYMDDGDYDTDYVHTALLTENPESIWGVAFQMNLTDEIEFWANYYDVSGQNGSLIADVGTDETGDVEQFGVGLNWFPSATPGFHIKTTYYTGEIDNGVTPLAIVTGVAGDRLVDVDYDGFEVTLRRDF